MPHDVATIDGIIRAFYDVVSGPIGEAPDRARDESLHRPGAWIQISRYGSDGRPVLLSMDLAGYHDRFGGVRQQPFYEWEIRREVHRFGNIAHVWSTYTMADRPDGPSTGRGVNSITLYNDGLRWWITGWSDERERPGQPVPSADLLVADRHAPEVRTEDVGSMDAIITALYDVISGPRGQPRDWNRMRSLFHDDAQLIPTGRTSAGQHVARPMTVEEYISNSGSFLEEIGFREEELARHVDRFGNIAQVFSSYAGYRDGEDEPFLRGINSIQLYFDDRRWWIMNVFWEPERPGVILPPEYERRSTGASEPDAPGDPSAGGVSDYRITVRDGYELHAPADADLQHTIEEIDHAIERFEHFFGDAPYIAVTLFADPSDMVAFDLAPLHTRGVPHLPWFLGGREPPSLEGTRALSHEACHTLFLRRIRHLSGWTPPPVPPTPDEVRYGAENVPDWMDEAAALLCEFPALQEQRAAQLAERIPLPLDSLFEMEHPSLPTLRQMLAEARGESGVAVGRHTAPRGDPLLFYAQTLSVATYLVEVAGPRIMARLADALAAGATMQQALGEEPALPDSIADLEEMWRQWLTRR